MKKSLQVQKRYQEPISQTILRAAQSQKAFDLPPASEERLCEYTGSSKETSEGSCRSGLKALEKN